MGIVPRGTFLISLFDLSFSVLPRHIIWIRMSPTLLVLCYPYQHFPTHFSCLIDCLIQLLLGQFARLFLYYFVPTLDWIDYIFAGIFQGRQSGSKFYKLQNLFRFICIKNFNHVFAHASAIGFSKPIVRPFTGLCFNPESNTTSKVKSCLNAKTLVLSILIPVKEK